ncbi:MAG: hydantoinase/oxoprolinase family protein [Gammaproteobacteria bacterium]|nr:hydantoinase/oxoprolinase family protein [Gammaproteobacteria bacterium]
MMSNSTQYTVGIDVGGTFTDFYCAADGLAVTAKTPTTHYDLSVGFMQGMRQLAQAYKLSFATFLAQIGSLRYSTTVGTNVLIERNGPKLGLFTTAGFEDTIFIGRARSWADGLSLQQCRDQARIQKPEPLIEPEMVVGVRERLDCSGKVITPLQREDVLEKLQELVDKGAQGFVVSLLWSFINPQHEEMIREIIEDEYPEDYLGSMPVILSSAISPKAGEYTRTMTAVVNSYIHGVMSDEINALENELRDCGYTRPLTLVHNTGGTKKASRTRAVHTHNAGPVAGLHGAATLGRLNEENNLIFTDMGGTSFDIGLIEKGEIKTHEFIPVIDRWRTNIPAIEVKSIGAGGGSIAWINALMNNAMEVGPQSAGAMPGPAGYDQGGQDPTVTDADLVLGLYNPENYLGGEMLLDVDLACDVISEKIAGPLGIDPFEAAYRIRRLVDARMGHEVYNQVSLKGHDPRNFILLACGGAGGAHACGYSPYIGTQRILVPGQSSVFGAFGASTMQIKEVWERSRAIRMYNWAEQKYLQDLEVYNSVVTSMKESAIRDLKLEGYGENEICFKLELDMRYGSQYKLTSVEAPALFLKNSDDVSALCDSFTGRYSEIYSPEATFPSGGINVETFHLTATIVQPAPALQPVKSAGPKPAKAALLCQRPVYWNPQDGFVDTPVYDYSSLLSGNQIRGPAIVEAAQTTYVIAHGWSFTLDNWGNAIIEMATRPGGQSA